MEVQKYWICWICLFSGASCYFQGVYYFVEKMVETGTFTLTHLEKKKVTFLDFQGIFCLDIYVTFLDLHMGISKNNGKTPKSSICS